MAHQVTVKGQVTIPKRVREHLGIRPGSGVEFEVGPKGDVLLRKVERSSKRARPRSRFVALRGTRKSGMTTDEIMNLLRGYDKDARDPGFKAGKK
ncbi:MAG: AbrB/MazE/SpoVT family DNA-binding domain-containing protein [Burkholderiales bacterium]